MLMGTLAALVLTHPAAAVDLTMYYPVAVGGPVTKIIDDMVGRFEKENAEIKVTAVYAGNYTDTMTKAMTAMKGGQPPQLSVLLSTDVFTLIDENAIVPLDGLVADKAWFKDFYPAFMANGQIDGKTWSIPFQRSTIVLYWNKDAFKEAGLDCRLIQGGSGVKTREIIASSQGDIGIGDITHPMQLSNHGRAGRVLMPVDTRSASVIFIIRKDLSDPTGHSISMFVSADQLLKGAALNAIQIAELLPQRAMA